MFSSTHKNLPSHYWPLAIFIFAAIGGMLYGFDLGIVSGALLFMNKEIAMTLNQEALLVGAVFGGGSLTTLISGFLSDWFGRKPLIVLGSLIFALGVLLVYFTHSYLTLLSGRFVQGVGVGIITIVVPLYLTESIPTRLRGRWVTAFQLLLTLGIFLSSLIGLYFTPSENWRAMFLTALVPGGVMFVGALFLSESPRWLAMKGRFEQAQKVLEKTRSKDEACKELTHIREALALTKPIAGQTESSCWNKQHWLPIGMVFSIAILQQLTGVNAFLQLSPIILKAAGLSSNMLSMLGTNAIMGLNFMMTVVAFFLVDKLERRTLMSVGTGGIVIAMSYCSLVLFLWPHGTTKGVLLLLGVLGFFFFYAVGPGALVWSILSEFLPSKVRSRGLAIALFLNSFASFAFSSVFLALTRLIGYDGVFGLCGFFAFLYFLICFFLLPKTKGQSLEEIEEQFTKRA